MRVRFLLPLIKFFPRFRNRKLRFLTLASLKYVNKKPINRLFFFYPHRNEVFENDKIKKFKNTYQFFLNTNLPFERAFCRRLINNEFILPNSNSILNFLFLPLINFKNFKFFIFILQKLRHTLTPLSMISFFDNKLVNTYWNFKRLDLFVLQNDIFKVTKPIITPTQKKDNTITNFDSTLIYRPSWLFSQVQFKWDLLNTSKITWPYLRKNEIKINFSTYKFIRSFVKHRVALRIINTTPTWRYKRVKYLNLQSYLFTHNVFAMRNFFLLNQQLFCDNSYNETRRQAFLFKNKIVPFRRKKKKEFRFIRSVFNLLDKSRTMKNPYNLNLFKFYNLTSNNKNINFSLFFNSSIYSNLLQLFIDFQAFKWILFKFNFLHSTHQFIISHLFLTAQNFTSTWFYNRKWRNVRTNLAPNLLFYHIIEKHFLKVISNIRYKVVTTPWHITNMHRFFTFCTGKKTTIRINGFIKNSLSLREQATCARWSLKVQKFRKLLGNFLFLNESLQILYLSFKLKDPYFLSNWLSKMFQKVSFWKSRVLLSYIRYVVRHFFFAKFKELNLRGLKFQLSGKISVAGNARTRTIRYKAGYTSQSCFDNKVLTVLNLLPSFTGVRGFKIWFFF